MASTNEVVVDSRTGHQPLLNGGVGKTGAGDDRHHVSPRRLGRTVNTRQIDADMRPGWR
ncbi:hypothetical protein [Rhodococcus jostii]|uniref:hypothetical protein n=1 Tax=Rhodococcus jostii TaxID=132919 RepID=UPI00364F9280